MSDIICTSSNAIAIVNSVPGYADHLRADKPRPVHHGKRPDSRWCCGTAVAWCTDFLARKIVRLKAAHPNAKFIAHPECEGGAEDRRLHIGSTTGLLKYTVNSPDQVHRRHGDGDPTPDDEASPKNLHPGPAKATPVPATTPAHETETRWRDLSLFEYAGVPELTMDEDLHQKTLLPSTHARNLPPTGLVI